MFFGCEIYKKYNYENQTKLYYTEKLENNEIEAMKNVSDSRIQKLERQSSSSSHNESVEDKLNEALNNLQLRIAMKEQSVDGGYEETVNKQNFRKPNQMFQSETYSSLYDSEESSSSSRQYSSSSFRNKKSSRKMSLPPIGVFWDIENCQVPKGRNATELVNHIREKFFDGYREVEFVVVCDVKKENPQILQELNDAQVNLIHVASTCKNAADDKLKQAIRRYADIHKYPSALILITSDINFASDLSDLRHRKRIHIILLHNPSVSDALLLCAQEHYIFSEIADTLPVRPDKQLPPSQAVEIEVKNLPRGVEPQRLKNRLKQLSGNCGGKVTNIDLSSRTAVIKFTNHDWGIRAQKRMEGEDVFGNKVSAGYPRPYSYEKSQSPFQSSQAGTTPHKFLRSDYEPNCASRVSNSAGKDVYDPMPASNNSSFSISSSKFHTNDLKYDYELFAEWQNRQPFKVASGLRFPSDLPKRDGLKLDSNNSFVSEHSQFNHRLSRGTLCKTPTEEMRCGSSQMSRNCSSFSNFGQAPLNDQHQSNIENDISFKPIRNYSNGETRRSSSSNERKSSISSVDLMVTNLDNTIESREMRSMLLGLFRDNANVLAVNVYSQSDGNLAASVKVASAQDAQYAISQLHRRRIGKKRINISYINTGGTNLRQLKRQITGLLQDVPGKQLLLFKFCELFESRYHTSITVSELYRLRDVCTITDDPSGRMVSLNVNTESSTAVNSATPQINLSELMYCSVHKINKTNKGWAEMEIEPLPNIQMGLKYFSVKIHKLLQSHKGVLPLHSLPTCYEAEFHEPLPIDETGVPLEHLVTCVAGVELRQSPAKQVVWISQVSDSDIADDTSSYTSFTSANQTNNTPLANKLFLFSREIIELLRIAPSCRLSFNKFIPAYHHHFGRQCRVADYGYTKLIELFESLPHIIQILGEGNFRYITLTHRVQIRRFTNDLLRILKSTLSKQVTVKEFSTVAERILERQWNPVLYGVCELEDLLSAVPEHIITINKMGADDIISLPKRDQTPEEMDRTKQFSIEAVELLRHTPQYSILFHKFVPAYHHRFNHQCRVADYGFSKLIELFESISDVVKIQDTPDGSRVVQLTLEVSLDVLASQIGELLTNLSADSVSMGIRLSDLPGNFLKTFGFKLQPESFESSSLKELILKLNKTICITRDENGEEYVQLVDRTTFRTLGLRVWSLLFNSANYSVPITKLIKSYQDKFNSKFEINQLNNINDIVNIVFANNDNYVELTPLYVFAAQAYLILKDIPGGSIKLPLFQEYYNQRFGHEISSAINSYTTPSALIKAIPDILVLKKNRTKRYMSYVSLNENLYKIGLQVSLLKCQNENDTEFDETSNDEQANKDKTSLESTVQEILWPTKILSNSKKKKTINASEMLKKNPWSSESCHDFNDEGSRELWSTPPTMKEFFKFANDVFDQNGDTLSAKYKSLMSPTTCNFSPGVLLNAQSPVVTPPPPSALPTPQLDSDTETNTAEDSSKSAPEPIGSKRKLRVAAQFKSPISLF